MRITKKPQKARALFFPLLMFIFLGFVPFAHAVSLFDQTIEKNNGVIPYPFEKLMDLFDTSKNRGADRRNAVLVPQGRSLQKDKADFKTPRIIFSASQSSYKAVFFGHAPASNDVEVISVDPQARSFEFKLIENYQQGKVPRVRTIKDSTCIVCHQNQGPIFSRAPWREMSNNRVDFSGGLSVVDEIVKHHPDFYHGLDMKLALGTGSRGSQDARNQAGILNNVVRDANRYIQVQNICKNICKNGDLECRSMLLQSVLEMALGKKAADPYDHYDLAKANENFSFPTKFEEFKKSVQAQWPQGGFGFPSHVLPDRDPLIKASLSPGFRMLIDERGKSQRDITLQDEKTPQVVPGRFSKTDGYILSEVPLRPEEASIADPLTPRPLTRSISPENAPHFVYSVAIFCLWPDLNDAGLDLEPISKNKFKTREDVEKVVHNPEVVAALGEPSWPDVRVPLMLALLKALGIQDEKVLSRYKSSELIQDAEKKKAAVTLMSQDTGSIKGYEADTDTKAERPGVIQRIKKHCGECHISGRMSLPLDNLSGLKEFRGKNGKTLLDRIRDGSMPPAFIKNKPDYKDWEADKSEIIRAIEEAKSLK